MVAQKPELGQGRQIYATHANFPLSHSTEAMRHLRVVFIVGAYDTRLTATQGPACAVVLSSRFGSNAMEAFFMELILLSMTASLYVEHGFQAHSQTPPQDHDSL